MHDFETSGGRRSVDRDEWAAGFPGISGTPGNWPRVDPGL